MVTYGYKPKSIDSLFIPIVNEIIYFNKNTFNVYNSYTKANETMNIALILFIGDMELQMKILKFGHWAKHSGCNMCTKITERHGRKTYFPTTPLRGRLRDSNTIQGVSGRSILSYVPYFDIMKQCPNDTMHMLWCGGTFLKILDKCIKHITQKVSMKDVDEDNSNDEEENEIDEVKREKVTKENIDSVIDSVKISQEYGLYLLDSILRIISYLFSIVLFCIYC